MSLMKRSIAEVVGTFILVYFGAGSAAITLMISKGSSPPNPFNIGIGSLGGLGDWFAIGMAFAIAIAASIYALGRISGAHLNPAVTIALWATKRFPAGDVVPYILAQLVGASLASFLFAAAWAWTQLPLAVWELLRLFLELDTGRQSWQKQ